MFIVTIVAGARPNFVKIAPIIHEIIKRRNEGLDLDYRLVHTGQHYDTNMSGNFFSELEIPDPHVNLNSGSGTQAEQTAAVLVGFEDYLFHNPTDVVLVVGDVNSTMAAAISAKKLRIPVVHVEAGIRSYDLTMPEEINRLVTDSIADYYFTTTEHASENLRKSGIANDRISFVGNCMIDTLLKYRSRFTQPIIWKSLCLKGGQYLVLTLHRPSNVDDEISLERTLNAIVENSGKMPLIFPVHPRTKTIIERLNFDRGNIHLVEPLSYLEFNYLVERSLGVITDSGGITEETTVLGVPCITLRENTERPETVKIGTNVLVGTKPVAIANALKCLFEGNWKKGEIPERWDGKTASRIIQKLIHGISAI